MPRSGSELGCAVAIYRIATRGFDLGLVYSCVGGGIDNKVGCNGAQKGVDGLPVLDIEGGAPGKNNANPSTGGSFKQALAQLPGLACYQNWRIDHRAISLLF